MTLVQPARKVFCICLPSGPAAVHDKRKAQATVGWTSILLERCTRDTAQHTVKRLDMDGIARSCSNQEMYSNSSAVYS